jgi:hypothetical protein
VMRQKSICAASFRSRPCTIDVGLSHCMP